MAQLVDYFVVCGIQGDRPLQETKNAPHSSHLPPFMRTYTPRVLARFPLKDHFGNTFDDAAVCALCAPEGMRFAKNLTEPKKSLHCFLITRENASRAHGVVLTYYERVEDPTLVGMLEGMQTLCSGPLGDQDAEHPFQSSRDKLFVTKSLCFISSHPLVKPLQAYLEQLYAITAGGKTAQLPVECYLFNVLYKVPMPRPGHKVVISGPLGKVMWRRPAMSELPLCDFSFLEFFELLGTKNILRLLTCLLLEHQVLLKSADYQRLMLCAFCSVSLLFPFNWHHVFVPILPASQVGFLDAPVPFLMGLHVDPLASSRASLLQLEASFCCVDIDRGTVEYTDELVPMPDQDRLVTRITAELKRHCVQAPDLCDAPDISEDKSSKGLDILEMLRKQVRVGVGDSEVVDMIRRAQLEENSAVQSPTLEGVGEWDVGPSTRETGFSAAVRLVLANYFVEHFANYENFVITPQQSFEDWQKNRDQFQNFDKSAFLSDQPSSHWPFYSAFLESTLFSGFIDEKLLSQWRAGEVSTNITLFDSYIDRYKDKSGLSKPPTTPGPLTDGMLGDGILTEEVRDVAPPPTLLEGMVAATSTQPSEVFPHLDPALLQFTEAPDVVNFVSPGRLLPPSLGSKRQTSSSGFFHSQVKFVNQLWRESRLRVKHMLGSTGESLNYIEENTHIAYLCELLERVWGHGLKKREGKSPLWGHLMAYAETKGEGPKLTTPSPLATSLVALNSIGEKNSPSSFLRKRFNLPQLKAQIQAVLQPQPPVLLDDLRIVASMSELKTDVGRARAFVRLTLEKKCLSRYLSELLSNKELTSQRYREYAFLCTDDEREQFLYHLLTLTARDFTCFTTGFLNTKMTYRVIVVGEGKHFGLSTSTLLVTIAGEYLDSGRHEIPKGEFSTDITTQNLGPLTCLRVGHDGTGLAPGLFVHAVLVHVITTGQTYRCECDCWLARNEGDGATERFLLAQSVPHTMKKEHSISTLDVESVLPSRGRRLPKKGINEKTPDNILATLRTVVNNLCENVRSRNRDAPMHRQDLLYLLCGANGFCSCMEELLLWQFKASRKFQKHLFVWDMLECLQQQSGDENPVVQSEDNMVDSRSSLVDIIVQINSSHSAVGKSEKLVILLCIGLRQHTLVDWMRMLASIPSIRSMYEAGSFLTDPGLLKQATDILSQIHTVTIKTELLLTQGL